MSDVRINDLGTLSTAALYVLQDIFTTTARRTGRLNNDRIDDNVDSLFYYVLYQMHHRGLW